MGVFARTRSIGTAAAVIASLMTVAYAGMKVVMAIRGELGLPGFPPKPTSDTTNPDIARNEWTLALLGLVAAGIAAFTLLPVARRVPRWLLACAVWAAGVSQAFGAIGMTLRATRIMPDLGPEPTGWTTWAVLLVLDIGAVAWIILGWNVARRDAVILTSPRRMMVEEEWQSR